jgi:DNA-binding PadR family transcriptional regulator
MFRRHFSEYGPHPFAHRLFERGDLKYVVLDLLSDKPSHGYEIMRALEEQFHGFYSPSAGSIYPTLQMLEDLSYIKASVQDGKKVYSITAEGQAFYKERKETIEKIKNNMHDWHGHGNHAEVRETMHELFGTMQLLRSKFHTLEPGKIEKVTGIISKACREIKETIA